MLLTEEYCCVRPCGMKTAQAPPKRAGNQTENRTDFFFW